VLVGPLVEQFEGWLDLLRVLSAVLEPASPAEGMGPSATPTTMGE
jgi:hypothetical protein